ncbi:c-type cytochrome [Burkholderia plantarii]|uniref:c-type cytochrome n=1 Tax=Burkholderia plantarii TaxID=41899 RepID=UPI0018DE8083|nr:cytochrome c [Burkholderia plantarii]MBI0327973.1 c-type cytochrome [Burkholderia plantarii]
MLKRAILLSWLLTLGMLAHGAPARPDHASEPVLELAAGGKVQVFTARALLARPDAADIAVPRDIAYGRLMRYRAVPLADLIDGTTLPPDTVIETRATDGFAAQLPMDLVRNRDPARAVAYLAVEDPSRPWPKLPGKPVTAGPFYLVWAGAQAASVRSEQWPYQVAQLAVERAPAARWPALAVDPTLPATDPVRAGQRLFITQCLACHRFDGAGSSSTGPDLGRPANPVDYFQRAALHRYIRNPASLRDWPGRAMPGFSPDQLSDREIDLIITYLAYMAHRR